MICEKPRFCLQNFVNNFTKTCLQICTVGSFVRLVCAQHLNRSLNLFKVQIVYRVYRLKRLHALKS